MRAYEEENYAARGPDDGCGDADADWLLSRISKQARAGRGGSTPNILMQRMGSLIGTAV